MEIPVVDFSELEGKNRSKTMAVLHNACEHWGFFMIDNHGVDIKLMNKVKTLLLDHYETNLKDDFYKSDIVNNLEDPLLAKNTDWETAFLITHRPSSNILAFDSLSKDSQETIDAYIEQAIKLAEKLSELMCENLGLEKNHIKEAFLGTKGPTVGTKVANYPSCPQPDKIRGLREHTDAGGIIVMLQDDEVPGLEFLKDGQWVKIPTLKDNKICINTGDQIEILSNGLYKSILHRVMAEKEGSRLSVATFYNPSSDAVIYPASKLLYPQGYSFKEYMDVYAKTKFGDKAPRLQLMKKVA